MKKSTHFHYEIRWRNFRGFEDTGWMRIAPLTILIGPNNSGKTSVLAPLLLLNQTVISRDSNAALVTRGPLIDVGTFRDFAHNHDSKRDVFFGLRFHIHDLPPSPKAIGEYPPGALELTFRAGATPDTCVLQRYAVYDVVKRLCLVRTRTSTGYNLRGPIAQGMKRSEKRAILRSQPLNFMFSPTREIFSLQNTSKRRDTAPKAEFSDSFSLYLSTLSVVFNDMRSMLDELSYIGPLRQRATRYYEVLGEKPSTVGPAGQRAPDLLRRRYQELKRSVNHWVRVFGIGSELTVNKLSRELFQLILHTIRPNIEINLADAGFGASQVLPLIIQAAAAPPKSITLVEQPEVHLNPRLQALLADLFTRLAQDGRRIVVETHSEHLLLRLRRLIADGTIRNSDVAVYYVERRAGKSSVREVPVDADGHIQGGDWPAGFFQESLKESLALATAQAHGKGGKS